MKCVWWAICIVMPHVIAVTFAVLPLVIELSTKTITVNEGDATEFTCKANEKLDYCLIRTPKSQNLNFDSETSKIGRFSYVGQGLDSGDCGLKISNVTKDDDGDFEFRVLITGDEDDQIGTVKVIVAIAPEPSEVNFNKKRYKDGETMQATCSIRNGRPAADNVKFYFDGKIFEGTSTQTFEHPATENSLATFTVESLFSQIVTWRDNGKTVRCSASHHSWNFPMYSSEEELYVDFKPTRETTGHIHQYIDTSATDMEQSIKVPFFASPEPKSLCWHIDSHIIHEGQSNHSYHAKNLQTINTGEYEAILHLLNVTPDLAEKTFQLTVINYEGTSYFSGTVTSKNTTQLAAPVKPTRETTGPIQQYIDTSATDVEQSINVTFFASPRPRSLSWNIDGRIVHEGQSNELYHATSLRTIKTDVYEARLRLLNVTPNFTEKTFQLTVINDEGTSYFHGSITIKNTSEPAAPETVKPTRKTEGPIQHYIDTSPTDMEQSINVIFFARPEPKSLSWNIDGLILHEGQCNDLYCAPNLRTIKTGEYEAKLFLLNVTPDFTAKTFQLTVINDEGTSYFSGTITSKNTTKPAAPETGPGIALIVIGIVLIVIAIILHFVVAKKLRARIHLNKPSTNEGEHSSDSMKKLLQASPNEKKYPSESMTKLLAILQDKA